jgi:hypothetical protein
LQNGATPIEGFFEISGNGTANFQFGYVRGAVDYREVERDGKPAAEFTWVAGWRSRFCPGTS